LILYTNEYHPYTGRDFCQMILHHKNGLQFFTFSIFRPHQNVRHAVFTRNDGQSSGNFGSLNTGFFVGDNEESVIKNRQRIARCMGAEELEFVHQVHQIRILVLPKIRHHYFLPPAATEGASPGSADALITDISGRFLAIQVADCQSVLLYDPQKQVIANIHSGWRGSVENIISATVRAMENEFGCRPEHILAAIAPSLGPCCAEFIHYQQEIPKSFWRFKRSTDHFNFWQISRMQLEKAGILTHHIEFSNTCTKCNPHLFFSYREKKQTGRFVSVIGLQ